MSLDPAEAKPPEPPLPTRKDIVADMRERIKVAMLDQINILDVQAITKEIILSLQRKQSEVVWKLMGFENRYGNEWQVDHCNGRAGNSPIGAYIASACQGTLEAWVKEVTEEVVAKERAKIKSDIKDALIREIRVRLSIKHGTTRDTADRFIAQLSAEALAEIKAELFDEPKETQDVRQ